MPIKIIPKALNKQAISQCNIWRNEKYENLLLIKNNVENVKQLGNSVYSANFPNTRDFLVAAHNHPSYTYNGVKNIGSPLSPDDCLVVLEHGGKKIIAGTENGFSSMDFCKSTLNINEARDVLKKENENIERYALEKVFPKAKSGKISEETVNELLNVYLQKINIALAKKYKWIYSEVKWSDYKK